MKKPKAIIIKCWSPGLGNTDASFLKLKLWLISVKFLVTEEEGKEGVDCLGKYTIVVSCIVALHD